ncbi:Aste57867_19014 [Aphanomyces stellatus]|uniref:subtilisin n=1 Tax=Aphanomyces stellatus TaxID=120398 RepID=A0A485LC63_9STRA|nr:hypothetical protein As57867_018950 [Aphanomyces stellatus]VFT95739.1 Aste57867_19014 [Aphanomyces stellatus]
MGSYSNDQLAAFSSKEPFRAHHSETKNSMTVVKPNISAPGFFTLSAHNNTGYVEMAGTSMAPPHVSDVVALPKSANPDLTYDEIYVTKTATRPRQPEPFYWPSGIPIAAKFRHNLANTTATAMAA